MHLGLLLVVLLSYRQAVQGAFGYTQFTFTNVVPGANATPAFHIHQRAFFLLPG